MQTIERSPEYVEKRFDMNHLIDTDPQDPNSDDERVADPELCASTSFVLNEGEELSTLPRTECASFDTESQDEVRHEVSSSKGRREQATQLKFLETLIDRLLSTMGFRKAKTPNGCSAILWDDNLLLW
jgi:hypothetical protein